MRRWLNKLNNYYLVAMLTIVSSIFLFLCMIPCFFFKMNEIPQGLILGSFFASIFYILLGIFEKRDVENMRNLPAIIISALRLFFFVVLLTLLALFYYRFNLKVFNIFSFTGGYLLSTLFLVIVNLIRKEK